MRKREGFTLIELLIVVGIISVLAGIIYVAVDPAKRLQDARDAERWSSVNSILNAVLKKTLDDGALPSAITGLTAATNYVLGAGGTGGCATCAAVTHDPDCVALEADLVDEYLSAMPIDPQTGDADNSGYYISRSTNNRIAVGACEPEQASAISVSR